VVDTAGKEVLVPTVISLKRTISFNESQVLAKESEEGLLYRDMQSDLVQQIMRRLAVLKME
jgi:LPS-assembly lipoprotein